jgi:hypothetical protein
MPISTTDDKKIITKYYNKSMTGCSISCLFIAIILTLILYYGYKVGIEERLI